MARSAVTDATSDPPLPRLERYYYYSGLVPHGTSLLYRTTPDYPASHMMDKAINLLVAFDSDEREAAFDLHWRQRLRGSGEAGFALHMGLHYALRPWRLPEALYLWRRKRELFPQFRRPEHMRDGKMHDRTVVFSRAVWKFWGGRQMVIPDLATSAAKFAEAVERKRGVAGSIFRTTRCTASASGCARITGRITKCRASRRMPKDGLTAASSSR